MSDHAELEALTRALGNELARRGRHGLRHVTALPEEQPPAQPPRPVQRTAPETSRGPAPAPERARAQAPAQTPAPAPAKVSKDAAPKVPKPAHRRAPAAAPQDLDTFRRAVSICMNCGLSAGPRGSGALLGRGAARPKLVFITDFAGPAERHYGKVLTREAGEMISNMVTRGFGLQLAQVYVTAAVKCPLGQGCQPSPKEAKTCSQHLMAELELLRPTAIVAFGPLAALALGQAATGGIEPLRGRLLQYKGSTPVVVTAHPRDMLADPSLKPAVWQDLQLLLPLVAPA